MLETGLETDSLKALLTKYQGDAETLEKVLYVSTASFLTFCERNWNPHPEEFNCEEFFGMKWPSDIDVTTKLQRDSEPIYVNIIHPELLYFSTQVFNALCTADQSLVSQL